METNCIDCKKSIENIPWLSNAWGADIKQLRFGYCDFIISLHRLYKNENKH